MTLKQVEELLEQGILTPGKGAWIKYGDKNIGNGKVGVVIKTDKDPELEAELLGKLAATGTSPIATQLKTEVAVVPLEVTEKLGLRRVTRMVDTQVSVPHPDNPNVFTVISKMVPTEFEVLGSLIDLDEAKQLGKQDWKEKIKTVPVKGGGVKTIHTGTFTCVVNSRRFVIDKETHGSL